MITDVYSDIRKVEFKLPADLPPHLTPKGKRPLQPKSLRISYSVSYPRRIARIYVELGGEKLENDATYGRSSVGDYSKRTFGTPWGRDRPDDAPATFDELGLPEWARPYVEGNVPSWFPLVQVAAS